MALKGTFTDNDGLLKITGLTAGSTSGELSYSATSDYLNTETGVATVKTSGNKKTYTIGNGTNAWNGTFGTDVKKITNSVELTVNLNGASNLESYAGGNKVDTITLGGDLGKLATANAGAGNDVVNVAASTTFGSDAKVDLGAGNDTITALSDVEIVAGAGNDSINIGSDTALTFTKAIDLGAGNDIINISQNATLQNIKGNNGKNIFNIDGAATVTGGAGGDTFNISGTASIAAGKGANTFNIEDDATVDLVGGAGADTFNIGKAQSGSKISAGKGNDVFILANDAANVSISDYNDGKVIKTNGTDRIVFDGVTADMISATYDSAGNVTLNITSDTKTASVTLAMGSNASLAPLNIYSTNLNGKNPDGTNITDRVAKAASQAAYKNPVFSQAAVAANADTYVITSTNAGANVYVKGVTKVDAGTYTLKPNKTEDIEKNRNYARTAAVNLTVEDNSTSAVNIIGSTKNDTINFKHNAGGKGFIVDAGSGNDTFVIDSTDVALTLTSYDLNKDVIKFGTATGITSADQLSVEIIDNGFKLVSGDFAINFEGQEVSDGTTKGTNLMLQFGTGKAAAYYATDPSAAAITALSKETTFDFSSISGTDTLLLGTNNLAGKDVYYDSDVSKVSFAAVNAKLNITAGAPEITASKGNDTILGAATEYNQAIATDGTLSLSNFSNDSEWQTDTSESVGQVLISLTKPQQAANDDRYSSYYQIYVDSTGKVTKLVGNYNDAVAEIKDNSATVTISASRSDNGLTSNTYVGKLTWSEAPTLENFTTALADTADADKISYKYSVVEDINQGVIDGSAGNDLFVGNVRGGEFVGGAGNDTFRSGAANLDVRYGTAGENHGEFGDFSVQGGLGNDVFVFNGEGNLIINDYSNVKNNADKIIFSYDNYKSNQNAQVVGLTSYDEYDGYKYGFSSANDDGKIDLLLGVRTMLWNGDYYGLPDGDNPAAQLPIDGSGYIKIENLQFGSDAQDFNVTYQGVNYTQKISSDTSVTGITGNYLGYLNPEAATIAAASDSKKNLMLIGNEKTVSLVGGAKNDTLVNNHNGAAVEGGAGNDVFDITAAGAVIKDYGNGSDKILVGSVDYISSVTRDGDDIILTEGGENVTTIVGGANKDITFIDEYEEYTYKNDTITGTKKTTSTMVRKFGTDATVKGGASTYLQVFSGDIDSDVKTVIAGSKATTMDIAGKNVKEVTGSGKADVIHISNNTYNEYNSDSEQPSSYVPITLKTGAGNDIIHESTKGVVITDFTAATAKGKTGEAATQYKAGDILEYWLQGSNGEWGEKIGSELLKNAIFEGQDVVINGKTLKNMKDKTIAVVNSEFDEFETDDIELLTLTNAHEFAIPSTVANKKGAEINASAAGSDITVIDATKYTKNAVITPGDYVTEIYAGKGVDTIYAGAGVGKDNGDVTKSVIIDSGAGADLIVFDTTHATYTTTTDLGSTAYYLKDYTNDKIVLDGVTISKAEITGNNYESTYKNKGKTSEVVTNYSDVTLTLSDDRTITLEKVANVGGAGFKIYVQDGTANNAPVQALEYGTSDVTIANADGNVINLTGAGIIDSNGEYKLKANVDSARSKALTIEGAAAGTVIDASVSKGSVTYIGNVASNGTETKEFDVDYDPATKSGTVIINGIEYTITLGTNADIENSVEIKSITGGTPANEETGAPSTQATINGTSGNNMIFVIEAFGFYGVHTYIDGEPEYDSNGSVIVRLNEIPDIGVHYIPDDVINGEIDEVDGVFDDSPITFIGGVKADKYVGNGSTDTVDFTRGGANIVDGAGRASIKFGTGKFNDTVILKSGDNATLEGFAKGGTDKIILDVDNVAALAGSELSNGNLTLTFIDEGNTYSTVAIKGYAGEAISISQNKYTNTQHTKVSAVAVQTVSFNSVNGNGIDSVVGSAAADVITVRDGISTVTAGSGNDTIHVESLGEKGLTITDFGTGTNVLTFTTAFTLNDMSSDYIYAGGNEVTIRSEYGNVILQGVGQANKVLAKTKTAIHFDGETDYTFGKNQNQIKTGIALQNNVTITASAANKDINLEELGLNFTKEYNNSTNQVTNVVAGSGLKSYKAGTKADHLTLASDNYELGIRNYELKDDSADTEINSSFNSVAFPHSSLTRGFIEKADNEDDSSALTYTYVAQGASVTDTITLQRVDTDQLILNAANGLTYEIVDSKIGDNTVTLGYKTGTKAAGSSGKLAITDNSEGGGNFTYTEVLTISDTVDDTGMYDFTYTASVTGAGIGTHELVNRTGKTSHHDEVANEDGYDYNSMTEGTRTTKSYGAAQDKVYYLSLFAGSEQLNGADIEDVYLKVTTHEDNNEVTITKVESSPTNVTAEAVWTELTSEDDCYTAGPYNYITFDTTSIGKLRANYHYDVTDNKEYSLSGGTTESTGSTTITSNATTYAATEVVITDNVVQNLSNEATVTFTTSNNVKTGTFTFGGANYTVKFDADNSFKLYDSTNNEIELKDMNDEYRYFTIDGANVQENTLRLTAGADKVLWQTDDCRGRVTLGGKAYDIYYNMDIYGGRNRSAGIDVICDVEKSVNIVDYGQQGTSDNNYTFTIADSSVKDNLFKIADGTGENEGSKVVSYEAAIESMSFKFGTDEANAYTINFGTDAYGSQLPSEGVTTITPNDPTNKATVNSLRTNVGTFSINYAMPPTFTYDLEAGKLAWLVLTNAEAFSTSGYNSLLYKIKYGTNIYGYSIGDPIAVETELKGGQTYTSEMVRSDTDGRFYFKIKDNSADGLADASYDAAGKKIYTTDEQYTKSVRTNEVTPSLEAGYMEREFVETTELFSDFITASVNDLESITTKTYNESAITADLTTNFAAQGNTFDLTSALTAKKKTAK